MDPPHPVTDAAVALVESYPRMNGYLTVTELQVQREPGSDSLAYEAATDLDVLAIRLPWAAQIVARRRGLPDIALTEDEILDVSRDGPDVLIAEVKEGAARLNRALQTPEVPHAALRRVGCCPEEHIVAVAEALATHGAVRLPPEQGVACRVRLAAFADAALRTVRLLEKLGVDLQGTPAGKVHSADGP